MADPVTIRALVDPSQPSDSRVGAGSSDPAAADRLSGPEAWVDDYGDYLYRYALLRLRDASLAEDMVQETFLAALKASAGFAGRSAPKSWLVGILKNKIADYYRKASRETLFTDLEFLQDEHKEQFIQEGPYKDGWIHQLGPAEWSPNPGAEFDNGAFWKTFHDCASKLPKNVSRVFLLREMDDVSTDEICALLNITPNNLWVMLHRARMALRRCLEVNWFERLGS